MSFKRGHLMNRLAVLVEGETERTFVRDQLADHLLSFGVQAYAILPGKSGRLRGVRKWQGTLADLTRALSGRTFVTTMFDFYAMPTDWPGRSAASKLPHKDRAAHVEEAVVDEIKKYLGDRFNPARFVPYVQLHEFEALTFSSPEILAATVAPLTKLAKRTLASHFIQIVEEAGAPEWINDSYESCPSRRITKLVKAYRKAAQGPVITARIGFPTLQEKCRHFASWIEKLEALGAGADS